MKTAKEFMEKLNSDEAFAKEISQAILAKKDAGTPDYSSATVAVAAEQGYEVTAEQVREFGARFTESVSEEELGKVAGGQAIDNPCGGTMGPVVPEINSLTCPNFPNSQFCDPEKKHLK